MLRLSLFRRVLVGLVVLVGVLSMAALPSVADAQEQPKRGGTFVVAINGDPPHLNASITTDTTTSSIAVQMVNGLVIMDRDMKVQPDLAERWEVSKDGLTFTFYLHKNVKWHDGKPLTSEDVKFSLMEINRKYKGTATVALQAVESMETPDPYTLVVKLKTPFPGFWPWAMVVPHQMGILPKHLYEGTDPMKNDYNLKPVGSGPFIFKEWVRGSHITLERNPNYFKPGQPYLDRVVFKIIPDAGARTIALEKGEVDYLNYLFLPRTAVKELGKNPNTEVVMDKSRLGYGVIVTFFNLRHPQLKIREVRQAIAHALDRQVLVDKAADGLADPGSSPVSSHQKNYYNPNIPKYEYNVAKANQLLDQAGLPRKADGTRLSLRLGFRRGDQGGTLDSAAEIMREQLKAVGINLELQPMDAAAWSETTWVKWDYDLTVLSVSTGPDPVSALGRLWTTENIKQVVGSNLTGYSNPKVDELFKAAEREADEAKLVAMYHEIQNLIVQDAPAVWLWDNPSPVAYRKTVKPGLPSGASHYESFDGIWLTTAGGGEQGATPWVVAGLVAVVVVAGGVLVVRRRRAA